MHATVCTSSRSWLALRDSKGTYIAISILYGAFNSHEISTVTDIEENGMIDAYAVESFTINYTTFGNNGDTKNMN